MLTDTPIQRFLDVLYRVTEKQAKPTKRGYIAICPAHDDRNPSLSIAEGDDSRVLLHCHAGCAVDEICAAVGLSLADLMPVNGVNVNKTSSKSEKTGVSLTLTTKSKPKSFTTANDAVVELERRHGRRSALWTYHNDRGEPVGLVVRWALADGRKDIRPVSRHEDGWRIGGMPAPRPLYRLPDLGGADRVYVCEGEKAAEAIGSIGLVATTSAHGCESPGKTDWQPLAGKEVLMLPDNDQPGRKYAEAVVAQLAKLSPAPVVKIVELPDLPIRGDAADFVAERVGTEPNGLRAIVEQLADEAEPIHFEQPAPQVPRYKPFPVDVLPQPIRGFVSAGAKAIGCAVCYVALPMLTVLAAAIGNSRSLQLKRGWTAPSIIWTAIVGESGTAKTPAFKLVMRPVHKRQGIALQRHREAVQEYEIELAHWEKALAEWKRDKKTSADPPVKPEIPKADRYVVSDTTVEALAPLLLENSQGLLLARDELAGWIGSFDRYSGGKGGADESHWLSMHNGQSITVDRKTGNPRTIYVPQSAVSITGGIQPTILHRALGAEHRESGLAARILLACPPRKTKKWTEADIDPAAEAEIARLLDRLYELQPTTDEDGESQPVVLGLASEAKRVWKTYYNSHAQEQVDLTGELSAAWSKLEEYAARFALVIHCVRWAAGDPTLANDEVVDKVSMTAGIRLVDWFKCETQRIYAILSETDEERDQRRLIEWIDQKGGAVAARDVQMGCRWLRESGAAEAALEGLSKAALGHWQDVPPGPKGGRPSRVFRLSTSTKPAETRDSEGLVDVDTVDAPDDEWGAV